MREHYKYDFLKPTKEKVISILSIFENDRTLFALTFILSFTISIHYYEGISLLDFKFEKIGQYGLSSMFITIYIILFKEFIIMGALSTVYRKTIQNKWFELGKKFANKEAKEWYESEDRDSKFPPFI